MSWLPVELDPTQSHTEVAMQIRVRQAVELTRQLPITVGGNLSLSALTTVVLWDTVPPVLILVWLSLFWLTAVPGVRQWIKYRSAPAPERISDALIWRAVIYSLVVAAPWALGNWLFFDATAHGNEIFLIFVTGGLTAGVVTSLAIVPMVSLVFVAVITAPLSLRLLLENDTQHAVMAIMLVIYAGFLSTFVINGYRRLISDIKLEIEKHNLQENLSQTYRRLTQAMQRTSDIIILFDANERLVLGNAQQSGSVLFRQENLHIGVSLEQIIRNSVDHGIIMAAHDREQSWVEEFFAWFRKPDRDFVIETSDNYRFALTAQPAGGGDTFLVFADVTGLYAESVKAKASAQRLADFAEAAADWMWELDANAIFTLVAPHRDSTVPVMFLLGQPLDSLAQIMPNKEARIAIDREIRAKVPFRNFRFRIVADGKIWNLSASGKPVFDDKGNFTGHRGIFRDVTEEVKVSMQLREAKNRAEDASKAKSEFLAHMSHELRTPLNAIIGFSEAMSLGVFGQIEQPKYREYVADIHDSGKHLLSIINDILDISRIESGKGELSEENVDVYTLIQDCLRMIEGRAVDVGHTITVETPPVLPGLWADKRMLKQILINLLGNAVKFTPDGGEITLYARMNGEDALCLSVRDNGPGIPAENLVRVLTPFDRGDAHTRSSTQGSGLGLPLSKMLMDMHGGTLDLKSTVGQGTMVTVAFPPGRTRRQATANGIAELPEPLRSVGRG